MRCGFSCDRGNFNDNISDRLALPGYCLIFIHIIIIIILSHSLYVALSRSAVPWRNFAVCIRLSSWTNAQTHRRRWASFFFFFFFFHVLKSDYYRIIAHQTTRNNNVIPILYNYARLFSKISLHYIIFIIDE